MGQISTVSRLSKAREAFYKFRLVLSCSIKYKDESQPVQH